MTDIPFFVMVLLYLYCVAFFAYLYYRWRKISAVKELLSTLNLTDVITVHEMFQYLREIDTEQLCLWFKDASVWEIRKHVLDKVGEIRQEENRRKK